MISLTTITDRSAVSFTEMINWLNNAGSMQSEIFVPITPKPVFTELKKPLSECKVAFITAGGIHRKDQTPFNTSGDFSYRTISFDTPSDMLMVTHGGFDNSDINKDVNAMFPIDRLHELEAAANRERIIHWGPRTLDLDILFYDNEIIDTPDLHIPHIDMENRDFVLKPLDEIAPYYRHPVLNKTIHQLLTELNSKSN